MFITTTPCFYKNNNYEAPKPAVKSTISFQSALLPNNGSAYEKILSNAKETKEAGKELFNQMLPDFREELRTLITSDSYKMTSSCDINLALCALAEIGIDEKADNSVIKKFVLKNIEDHETMQNALYALQTVGQRGDKDFIKGLSKILSKKDTNNTTFLHGLEALETVGTSDKNTTKLLLENIKEYFSANANSNNAKSIRYQLLETLYVISPEEFKKLDKILNKEILNDKILNKKIIGKQNYIVQQAAKKAGERNSKRAIGYSEKNRIDGEGFKKILIARNILEAMDKKSVEKVFEELGILEFDPILDRFLL